MFLGYGIILGKAGDFGCGGWYDGEAAEAARELSRERWSGWAVREVER